MIRMLTWRSKLKRVLPIILIALPTFLLAGCAKRAPLQDRIVLSLLNLGQADSMILQVPGAVCLIDAGDVDSSSRILEALRRRGIGKIDLAVLTHPHEDHIGGLREVGQSIPVQQILDSGFPLSTTARVRLLNWIRKQGIPFKRAVAGQKVMLGDKAQMDVLWPATEYLVGTECDENNNSVVLRIRFGGTRILLLGDLQEQGEAALLETGVDLKSDAVKVAHQGSRDATSDALLSRVRPTVAMISVGEGNAYGHPDRQTLERLRKAGIRVLRTDIDGEITLESDGRVLRQVNNSY